MKFAKLCVLQAYRVLSAMAFVFFGLWLFAPSLPIFDQGHRLVGVGSDVEAQEVVTAAIWRATGLHQALVIDMPPTKQFVMADGMTVVNKVVGEDWKRFSSSGVSFSVRNPRKTAEWFVKDLKTRYSDTEVKYIEMPGKIDPVAVVRSEAIEGSVVVFRRHALLMLPLPRAVYKVFYWLARDQDETN